jgi:nitronate monooxygenase
MWNETRAAQLLNIQYPIIQGPFGSGPSSPELVAAVSNNGGMGSYGMQALEPAQMRQVVSNIRAATSRPFSINLWISDETRSFEADKLAFEAAADLLAPYYRQLGLDRPSFPDRFIPKLDEQIDVLLELRPPVFSFVFGIPQPEVFQECKRRGILMMGTATTAEEAQRLEDAGADLVVASGFEAGGHKGSFLRPAEESLTGTFALVPQVADKVKIPVIAAGGVADARGVVAALALGADGVQIGTAFLACLESAANTAHRAALFDKDKRHTVLTKTVTGRLARNLRSQYIDDVQDAGVACAPYPIQAWLVDRLKRAAAAQGKDELLPFSAGQAVALVRHNHAAALMEELIRDTARICMDFSR